MQRILELDPLESEAWRVIALSYLFEGRYELAEEPARRAYELAQGRGITPCTLIVCLAAAGKQQQARQLYASLPQHPTEARFPAVLHAFVQASLGDPDSAMAWLEKAVTDHNFWLFSLKYSPEWNPMRSDSRFQKILQDLHFPD